MMLAITQRNVLASLLFFSMPASVLAANFTWQGPYAGAYLGGAFGNNHMSTNAGSVTTTSYFSTTADVNAVNNSGSWTKDPSTFIAGIRAGHDWTWNQIVYGVGLDYSTLSLSSSRTTTKIYPDNSDQYSIYTSMQTNWLFTLRGRLGYPSILSFPSLQSLPSLFYLTAGMALTQLNVKNNFSDNSSLVGVGNSNNSENQIGWTAGLGIEVATLNHLSVNFEYLYVGIPSVKTISTVSNTQGGFGIPTQSLNSALSSTADFHANIFTLGLNYRFDE